LKEESKSTACITNQPAACPPPPPLSPALDPMGGEGKGRGGRGSDPYGMSFGHAVKFNK